MRIIRSIRRPAVIWTALLALSAGFALASPATAATGKTFTVNTTADEVDNNIGDGICAAVDGKCSLRAAIQEANTTSVRDTIKLASGDYKLTIAGAGETLSATGDLNTRTPITIVGAGAGSTIIDAQGIDRALQVFYSSTTVSGVTVLGGNGGASGSGGGIEVDTDSALTLQNVVVKNNTASRGGGLFVRGQLTMAKSTIQGNHSSGSGGGLYSETGSISLSHVKVFNNSITSTSNVGAGIYNDASMSLSWSWVKGNTCLGCEGAGIDNDGVASITQSTISGNSSAGAGNGYGGGLATDNPTYLTNDTIYGNHASQTGGGIAAWGYTVLVNVTVTKNQADADNTGGGSGGGVAGEADGALYFRNSIVGANTIGSSGSDPNCYDDNPGVNVGSLGHNVLGPITGCPLKDFVSSDKKNVSALKLGTFGMHGGPTPTVPLLAGSPALKHGTNCPRIDQRGVKRPKTGCDAGAYERTPA
jgi:large repetitive protein